MGKFIVFEGIDGVGTTTQSRMLYEKLGRENVKLTFEPTGFSIGIFIRDILVGKVDMPSGKAMELLFRADRMDHIEKIIEPVLKEDKIVICDRYFPSTLVYQGMRDNLKASFLEMEKMFYRFIHSDGIILPDLTIVLDLDPNICQERINKREKDEEIYEALDFQNKVRNLYVEWVKQNDETWWDWHRGLNEKVIVDANGSVEEVFERCLGVIHDRIGDL